MATLTDTPKVSDRAMRFRGLTAAEVEESRRKHGANVLTPPERDPWWKLFLEKFEDPVIRILLIAAVIAIAVGIVEGDYFEGIGIIIAILLATVLAFLNEYKASKEFDILNKVNDEVPIKVIRDGTFTTIPRKDIVVGDVVLVEAGEEACADGTTLEAVSLQVDEARLTGEAEPVKKVASENVASLADVERAYPPDKVLRGTIVKDGHGIMKVTAVGDTTEIGKTARAAAEETGEETPLNQQLERLSKLIGVVGFAIAAILYVALVARGVLVGEFTLTGQQWYFAGLLAASVLIALVRVWLPIVYDGFELAGREADPPDWLEEEGFAGWLKTFGLGVVVFGAGLGLGYALGWLPENPRAWMDAHAGEEFLTYFMIAVTLIVVAVPEGLAMSVTLSLAYSMRKMTATNNLVRRMHACETIGAATVICSDKTGTLTMNEMRVFEVDFPALSKQTVDKDAPSLVEKLVIEGIAANTTANLSRVPGEAVRPLGNPTEGALLMWLENQGIDYVLNRDSFPITYQWTFSTERKYMGTLGVSNATNGPVLHTKGAPEIVMARCANVLTADGVKPLDDTLRRDIAAALKSYQARGMRTLGFAYHETPRDHNGVDIDEVATHMTWLGFAAIADPVRPEVPPAIQTCRKAGIQVKVVTGDNQETAQEIGRQIGLWEAQDPADAHIGGQEYGKLTGPELNKASLRLKILSRARPEHKQKLVKSLQEEGHVVAVTGDGVNDGPALNYANVGLAMGKTGTAVAKEASDIILLDDSFNSIANAVMWGRSLYENIQRFILFQLTINVVALGIALIGPFIGVKLPLTVTQMLWVNLIMDTFAALALATEPPHQSVMDRPPRDPKAFIVSKAMARGILSVGIIFLVFLIGFILYIQNNSVTGVEDGRPVEATRYELTLFFTTFVFLQLWNLFNAKCLGQKHSAFAGLAENKGFLIIAVAIFVGQILMTQFGGEFFRTEPLLARDWLIIIGGTSVVLWIGEIWRAMARARAKSA